MRCCKLNSSSVGFKKCYNDELNGFRVTRCSLSDSTLFLQQKYIIKLEIAIMWVKVNSANWAHGVSGHQASDFAG